MKFYVTKYALSKGLFEVDGEYASDPKYIRVAEPRLFLRNGVDCFSIREDAEERARHMAAKKLVSFRNKLAGLERLSREPKWRKP